MGRRLLRQGACREQQLRSTAVRAHLPNCTHLFVDDGAHEGMEELDRVLTSEEVYENERMRCLAGGHSLEAGKCGDVSELSPVAQDRSSANEFGRFIGKAAEAGSDGVETARGPSSCSRAACSAVGGTLSRAAASRRARAKSGLPPETSSQLGGRMLLPARRRRNPRPISLIDLGPEWPRPDQGRLRVGNDLGHEAGCVGLRMWPVPRSSSRDSPSRRRAR